MWTRETMMQVEALSVPGQSGDPASPHYGDLARRWAEGHYVPLLYSRARIDAAEDRCGGGAMRRRSDAAAERCLRLQPA